jgi:predicted  nucleic acid-binding Zn-ribbon protein
MTLSEIARQLETAVMQRGVAKAAVEAAEQTLDNANDAYATIVSEIRDLDKQYQAVMKDIFSYGGAVQSE